MSFNPRLPRNIWSVSNGSAPFLKFVCKKKKVSVLFMNPHIRNHTAAQTDRIISFFKELETLTLITPVVKIIILRFQIKKEKMQETEMEKC